MSVKGGSILNCSDDEPSGDQSLGFEPCDAVRL